MAKQKAERSYGLSAAEVKELTEQFKETKRLPNPHRTGAYKFTIDALLALGANKPHPLAKVHQAFRKAAGDEWYRAWARKEPRNKETGKSADERFLQNLQVLQRTSDYARKLLEVGRRVLRTKGAVIDLSRDDKGGLLVMLNTNSATPEKPGRAEKVEPKRASKPRKAGGKPSKAARKPKRNGKPKSNGNGGGNTPSPAPQQPQS